MEKVFLSYTYKPHADFAAATDALQGYARRVIQAMGLYVVDGVDLGGKPIGAEIRKRIENADALVAIFTPQAGKTKKALAPPLYVISEFAHASALPKPTFRILCDAEEARGLSAEDEYVLWQPGREVDVVLKLMNTLALWKRMRGRAVKLRCEPRSLASAFDKEQQGHTCKFQLLSHADGTISQWFDTNVWPSPGAAFVHVPQVKEDDQVRIRISVGGRNWQSDFVNPFTGTATLEQQP